MCKHAFAGQNTQHLSDVLLSEPLSEPLVETGITMKTRASFVGDAPRVWNKVPASVTKPKTLLGAKKP